MGATLRRFALISASAPFGAGRPAVSRLSKPQTNAPRSVVSSNLVKDYRHARGATRLIPGERIIGSAHAEPEDELGELTPLR